MKKALILMVTMSLILFYTLTATAETTKVYLDQMTNGTVSYNVTDEKWDSSSSFIGFEYMGERFKLGGELGFGSFETASSTEYNTVELTGGVRLINKNHFKLDAQITYQSNTLKSTDSADYSGIMCGGDMIIGSERSNVDFSLMIPVSGTTNLQGYQEIRLLNMHLKYNCRFTEHVGLAIGYRFSEIIGIYDDGIIIDGNEGATFVRQGATIGLTYKF